MLGDLRELARGGRKIKQKVVLEAFMSKRTQLFPQPEVGLLVSKISLAIEQAGSECIPSRRVDAFGAGERFQALPQLASPRLIRLLPAGKADDAYRVGQL